MAWRFTKVSAIILGNLTHWLTSTQVLRERATALEATVVAVESEVEVLETALFAMPEDGRHGCVPRLFLGDAAEGVIDLSEAPQPATLDTGSDE